MKRVFAVVLISLLGGCTNPYTQFYTSTLQGKDYSQIPRLMPHDGEPTLIPVSSKNITSANKKMHEDGFIMVGYSSFNAAETSELQLVAQAKAVKAHTVLYAKEYMSTDSGAMPMTLPNTQTTYHSGSLYGGGGFGNYSGTSTTYGTTTTYIPYSIDRYSYGASYWVKRRGGGLGVMYDNPPAEVRAKNGTNKGAMITTVVRNTSAYRDDILEGDVVVRVGKDDIADSAAMTTVIPKYYGKSAVEFEILRNGSRIVKTIDVDAAYK